MKHYTLSYWVLSIVVSLSIVLGMVMPVGAAPIFRANREIMPVAPSERMDDWLVPEQPSSGLESPFLDPTSIALKNAMGGIVDTEIIGGGVIGLEPLSSSSFQHPTVDLSRPSVALPTRTDPLASINVGMPLPQNLASFMDQDEVGEETVDFDGLAEDNPDSGLAASLSTGEAEMKENVSIVAESVVAKADPTPVPESRPLPDSPETSEDETDDKTVYLIYLPVIMRDFGPNTGPSISDRVVITRWGGTLISTDLLVRVDVPADAYDESFILSYTSASERGELPKLEATTLDGEPVVLQRAARIAMRLPDPEYRSGNPLVLRMKAQGRQRLVSIGATIMENTIAEANAVPLTEEMLSAYVYEFGEFTFASLRASAFDTTVSTDVFAPHSVMDEEDEGDDGLIVPGYCWEPGSEGPDYLLSFASVISTTQDADPSGFVQFIWDEEDESGEIYQEYGYIFDNPDSERTDFTQEPDFVTIGMTEINGENSDFGEPIPFSTLLTGTVYIHEWDTGRYDFLEIQAYFTPGTIACTAGCEGVPPTISGINLTQIGQGDTPGIGIGYLEIFASDNSGEFAVSVRVNGAEYSTVETNNGTFAAQVSYNIDEINIYEITVTDSCGNAINFPPIAKFGSNPIFDGSFCIGPCGGFQGKAGDPVNTQNGNYYDSVNDLMIPGVGGANIVLNRDYNSKSALWTGGATVQYTDDGSGNLNEEIIAGPPQYFGTAWTFPYAVSVNHLDLAPLYDGVEIHYPDGHSATFVNDGGVYVSTSPANFDTLTRTANGWELLHKSTLDIEYFDVDGRLSAKEDLNGNRVFLTYDGEYLTRVENDSGRWIEFAYTTDGYIKTVTAPEDRVIGYTYTGDLLHSVTNGNGHTTVYDYDENKQLITITTPKGHTSLNQVYDDKYRVDWQQIGRAEIVDFEYSEDDLTNTTTDNNGYPTIRRYNDIGQLIETEDALGYTEEYGYNAKFQRIYYKDKMGREWHWTYDENGNRLTEDGPMNWHCEWDYNALNLTTRMQDAKGRETWFDYDDIGNLIAITNAFSDTRGTIYDERGLPTNVFDFNGNETVNTYDPVTGDLLSIRNGAGDEVSYTYDELGRMQTMTDGRGNLYTYAYDHNDNLIAIAGPLGYHLGFVYDANDNLRKEIDPNGGVTEYFHDESELVTRVENQLDFATIYTYDDMDNLIRVEDAEGCLWTYEYDAVYNRVAEHGPEDTHTFFAYDGVGNLTDVTRCNSPLADDDTCPVNQVTHYEYDELGRVIEMVQNYKPGEPKSADTNVTTEYEYDLVGNLLELTDANGNSTLYEYDDLDRLIREEDAEHQITRYGYDANGNLVSIINPRGYETTFTYDGANRLETLTNARENTWTYAYDANGNLTDETDPYGVVTHYEYDALDRVSDLTQNYVPGAPATTDQNVTTNFAHDLAGNLRFVYDPRGTYQIEHQYDAVHRRVLTIDAEGGETEFGYDKVNNLTSAIDANDHETTIEYDDLDRQVKVTNPEGHSVEFEYDRLSNLLTLTDARENETTFTYDGMNRVVLRVDAMDGEWRSEYDAMGNLLRHTDANGNVNNAYTYDKVYRVLTITDGEGHVTSFTYDENGNTRTVTDGNKHVTTFTYDELDRLSSVTNAEDETTEYLYDALGNQTHLIEADGIVTLYGYDPLYRLTSVTQNYLPDEPESADVNVDTHYGYDEVGNLLSILDAEEHETRFYYDGLNRLVREVDAEGNTWDYEYDPVGNRIARIDAKRDRTEYEYYPDDQLERVSYYDGTSVHYTYDENNNRTEMEAHLGTTTWAYDALNRVTDVTDPFGHHLGYAYDPVGNRTGLTYPDGRAVNYGYYRNNWLKTVTDPRGNVTMYERDGVGQVTRQLNPNHTIAVMTYDKANRLLTLTNYQVDGAAKVNSAFTYTYNEVGHRVRVVAEYAWRRPNEIITSDYTYDGLRRLIRDEDSRGVWTDYTFDRMGNRLTLTTNDDSLSPRPFDEKTLVYSYNAINQVLTIIGDTHPGDPSAKRFDNVAQAIHAFQHEVEAQRGKHIAEAAADNLLALADALIVALYDNPSPDEAEVAVAIEALRAQVLADYQGGEIDRQGITQSLLVKLDYGDLANNGTVGELQTTTFRYDANGNRINKEFPGPQRPRVQGTDYAYDPENRLILAHDYQENLEGNRVYRAITELDYDGDGRRLVKEYDPKDDNSGEGKRVEYVFDGLDPVAEYNTWNPQYENFYRGDRGRIITMHHFPSGTEGQMYWFHYDGLGSTSGLTKQNGQSHHNYRYEPYGQIEMPPGNFTDPHNHYTFTGQEWDEHMGVYEFFARAYDYNTGTWLQQDSYRGVSGEPQSLHRYQYVYNDPISYYDPYGYCILGAPCPDAVEDFSDAVGDFVDDVGDGINDTIDAIGDAINDTSEAIGDTIKDTVSTATTYAEDMEALAVLEGAWGVAQVMGRNVTARLLGNYLSKGGDLSLRSNEMDMIIQNQGFKDRSSNPNIAAIINTHGPGDINEKDPIWHEHRFYNDPDGDLWSAFNDLRFKTDLNGCIEQKGSVLVFDGQITWHFSDSWGFSDPAMDSRRPFQFWDWLPDHYQNFTEGRFRRLEERNWVKPFNVTGSRTKRVDVRVDGAVVNIQRKTEEGSDSYN